MLFDTGSSGYFTLAMNSDETNERPAKEQWHIPDYVTPIDEEVTPIDEEQDQYWKDRFAAQKERLARQKLKREARLAFIRSIIKRFSPFGK